jgi:hypothetical protein
MIKPFFYSFMLIFLVSCEKEKSNPNHLPDEYVLIEFAASLEDEYEKIYPSVKKIKPEPPLEAPVKSH